MMPSIEKAVESLKKEILRQGFTPDDIDSLLRNDEILRNSRISEETKRDFKNIAKSIFRDNSIPDDYLLLAKFQRLLEDTIDIKLDHKVDPSKFSRLFRVLRTTFASLLIFLSLYFLVGGLYVTYPNNWILRIFGFIILLLILGIYEGLQISVASLRLKDIHAVRNKYPQAHNLHNLFHSELGTRKFFAGRQFFVVIIVFFAAQITSVPSPEFFPLSNISLPEWFSATIGKIFWDLGIAGAFITLWIGQLAPQFIANRQPIQFLCNFGMGFFLRAAIFLDDMGFTAAGTWLTYLFAKKEENVPVSAREVYRQYINELHGFGTIGIKKEWEINNGQGVLTYCVTAAIKRRGLESVTDDGLILNAGSGCLPVFKGHIITKEGEQRDIVHSNLTTNEEKIDNGKIIQIEQTVSPSLGSFLPGDTLILNTEVEFNSMNGNDDVVIVTRPTKYVAYRIRFQERPAELGKVTVIKNELDSVKGEYQQVAEYELSIVSENGTTFCEFIDFYPPTESQYILHWSYDHIS